jgi:stage II sporulation protein D
VVARTYTLRSAEADYKHTQADVCTDHTCCQAYVEPESYSGGASALDKVYAAVKATSGEVLTYGGELIEATYFSCSGGSTEDAVAVWGTDFPYLRAVDSPGEENAAHHEDTMQFTKQELEAKLGVKLTGNWLGKTTYTTGGGVDTVQIGGKIFTGKQLRVLLGLRSTAFTIDAAGGEITITTRGFGHRVGMSQYGAEAMAVTGSNFEEILYHYYQGTQLQQYIIDKEGTVG